MSKFLKIFWLALAVKIVIAVLLPMSTDEAYYWFWSQRPQLSFYDHPAMVAWLLFLGGKLDSIFGIAGLQISRIPSVILAHLSLYFWYLIFKKYLDEKNLILLLLFLMLSPLIGISALVVTPDAPLIFFWSASIYLFVRIFEENSSLLQYALLGASLGLGFCSKYHIILFVPAALLYIFFEKRWKKVRLPGVALCILFGLIFCLPVLYWNYKNNFISFRFQMEHGLATEDSWRLRWPLEYILGQFFLLFPPVVLANLKRPKIESLKIIFYFGWFTVAFFFLTSIKSKVEANWPIAAYPALTCLAFYFLRGKKSLQFTFAIWILAWILVFVQVVFPWIPIDEHELKTYELKKYDPIVKIYEKDPTNIFANNYQMASMISYKSRFAAPLIFKAVGMSRLDYFDFQKESRPTENHFRILLEHGQPLSKELRDQGYIEKSLVPLYDNFELVEVAK